MRVVRVQGCLPSLLLALAIGGVLVLAFTAGAVFLAGAVVLGLAGALARVLLGGRRPPPARPPRPSPGAARDMVVEVEGGSRPDEPGEPGAPVEPPRLPPGG